MTRFVFLANSETGTRAWPCKISVPLDGGKFEEQELKALFRVLPMSRVAEVLKPSVASLGQSGDVLLLKECLAGFEDLQDSSGARVPDDKAIPAMLEIPYVVIGLVRGYYDMVQGRLPKN
jgi:hypothetical protein